MDPDRFITIPITRPAPKDRARIRRFWDRYVRKPDAEVGLRINVTALVAEVARLSAGDRWYIDARGQFHAHGPDRP